MSHYPGYSGISAVFAQKEASLRHVECTLSFVADIVDDMTKGKKKRETPLLYGSIMNGWNDRKQIQTPAQT